MFSSSAGPAMTEQSVENKSLTVTATDGGLVALPAADECALVRAGRRRDTR
jgi:hypothetical protein